MTNNANPPMIARILPFRAPLAKLPIRQYGSDFVRYVSIGLCIALSPLFAAVLLALTLPWLRVIA